MNLSFSKITLMRNTKPQTIISRKNWIIRSAMYKMKRNQLRVRKKAKCDSSGIRMITKIKTLFCRGRHWITNEKMASLQV
jgi:hypothetical protein